MLFVFTSLTIPFIRCVIPAAREDRPRREFGFVHFEDVESAKRVVESNDTFTMDDKELNVRWGH